MTNTADSTPIRSLPPLTMPIEEAMRTLRALRRLRPDPVDDAAKSAAGGTGGRARRGVNHAAAVEYLAGTAGTRFAVAHHPLCRGTAGLANGVVRADDAAFRRRGRAPPITMVTSCSKSSSPKRGEVTEASAFRAYRHLSRRLATCGGSPRGGNRVLSIESRVMRRTPPATAAG
jgi:hypothetical protein